VEFVESTSVIDFPRPDDGPDAIGSAPVGAAALAEIDAAIALVAAGAARRVRLTALPFVESVAGLALARAAAAGMSFQFERPERNGVVTVTIGPVEPSIPR
jgi:hypothetical protein